MLNLVEAETLGRVGEDVGVNRVRNVGLPVGDRAFLGGERLHDAAQPREHGETAVLELLDLELFEVTRLGEAERVEAATRGDVTDGEFVEDRVGNAGTVRFGGANENDLDDENVPEGRVARAFRRERGDGARELVRDGGAVIRGAQGTRGEPRDAGAVFGGPGASDAQHGPSAVDDFTLGVLFVAERDDRGFAPTRVGTEFRVDVSLDNLGDGLGLFVGEKIIVIICFGQCLFLFLAKKYSSCKRESDFFYSYPTNAFFLFGSQRRIFPSSRFRSMISTARRV